MRRFAAVAILVTGLAVPALAQHGAAGHANFSGHAAPAPRAGFRAPSSGHFAIPSRPTAPARFGPSRVAPSGPVRFNPGNLRGPGAASPTFRYGYPGQRAGYRGNWGQDGDHRGGRDHDHDRDHHRRAYIRVYNWGYPYPYTPGFSIWPGYPTVIDDDSGYDDSSAEQDYPPYNGYADQRAGGYADQGDNGQYYGGPQYGYPDQEEPAQRWPSIGPNAPPYPQSQPYSRPAPVAAAPETAVTLVFKNGRTEQVHNYVLTKTYIFVGDARGVTIPIDQIDVAATEQANFDAGIDFHLPKAAN